MRVKYLRTQKHGTLGGGYSQGPGVHKGGEGGEDSE